MPNRARDGGSNAKIANVLEYGKHGQPAKPFLKPAKSASKAECIHVMEQTLEGGGQKSYEFAVGTECHSRKAAVCPVETGVFSDAAPDTYLVLTPLSDTFDLHADNRSGR